MSRPMPDHGTRARYLRGCHCNPCHEANRLYCKHYRLDTLRNGKRRISPDKAAQHARRLSAQGWSETQIGAAAGCSETVVRNLLTGRCQGIHPDIAAKILAAQPHRTDQPAQACIDATGTVRRGRALVANGYTLLAIANALDMGVDPFGRIINHAPGLVRAYTAHRVTSLYEQWASTPGPSLRSQLMAERKGWHTPDAWDDEEIDDPNAEPYALVRLDAVALAEERSVEVRLIASAGNTFEHIARRLGISPTGVRQILRRDHPNLYLELTA